MSEASIYRIGEDCDLITSPAFDLVEARDQYERSTRRVNELRQTDFTRFKVVGWAGPCTVLDDFSR